MSTTLAKTEPIWGPTKNLLVAGCVPSRVDRPLDTQGKTVWTIATIEPPKARPSHLWLRDCATSAETCPSQSVWRLGLQSFQANPHRSRFASTNQTSSSLSFRRRIIFRRTSDGKTSRQNPATPLEPALFTDSCSQIPCVEGRRSIRMCEPEDQIGNSC